MLIQICRSWHGERSRERRVSILVFPNLRDDVKASQDTHHPNCKFGSVGKAEDDFSIATGIPISVSSAPVLLASSEAVVDSPKRLNRSSSSAVRTTAFRHGWQEGQ